MELSENLSLEELFKVMQEMMPSGSRVIDTSRGQRGRQVWPKVPGRILKSLSEELGYDREEGGDE